MQNAKDSFYEVLRDRIAAGNAARTVLVRGTLRPAVVVTENELVEGEELLDCFCLAWTTLGVSEAGPAPMVAMQCEVSYATRGNSDGGGTSGGLDRGRALTAMDAELAQAVRSTPQWAQKKDFKNVGPDGSATVLGSRMWWSDVSFATEVIDGARMRRKATLTLWSFEEAGEL